MTSSEARSQLDELLKSAGATVSAAHVPTTYNPRSKEWQHIAWSVTVSTPRGKMVTQFRQGIGHLPPWKQKPAIHNQYLEDAIAHALKTGKVYNDIYREAYMQREKPLNPPDASDVISSLILDASAADYASYEEWADDYGYDADSRKGYAAWEACRNTAHDLRRLFDEPTLSAMRELANEL